VSLGAVCDTAPYFSNPRQILFALINQMVEWSTPYRFANTLSLSLEARI
jgi:hypothetical protein